MKTIDPISGLDMARNYNQQLATQGEQLRAGWIDYCATHNLDPATGRPPEQPPPPVEQKPPQPEPMDTSRESEVVMRHNATGHLFRFVLTGCKRGLKYVEPPKIGTDPHFQAALTKGYQKPQIASYNAKRVHPWYSTWVDVSKAVQRWQQSESVSHHEVFSMFTLASKHEVNWLNMVESGIVPPPVVMTGQPQAVQGLPVDNNIIDAGTSWN